MKIFLFFLLFFLFEKMSVSGYTYKLMNKHLEDERCQPHTHLDTVRVVQRFWAPQSGGYLTVVTDEENRGQKIRQNYGHFLPDLGLFWSFRSSRELPESSRELPVSSPGTPKRLRVESRGLLETPDDIRDLRCPRSVARVKPLGEGSFKSWRLIW